MTPDEDIWARLWETAIRGHYLSLRTRSLTLQLETVQSEGDAEKPWFQVVFTGLREYRLSASTSDQWEFVELSAIECNRHNDVYEIGMDIWSATLVIVCESFTITHLVDAPAELLNSGMV